MVVVCEKCETRFHLDDSRVPAKGARVRCSRCKHSFFIVPPGREEPEAIEEVVAEVTGAGGAPVPEVTRDLPDPIQAWGESELRRPPAQPGAEDRGTGEFEEDWEFNDDPVPESPPQPPVKAETQSPGIGEFDATALEPPAQPSEPEIAAEVATSLGKPESETPPAEEERQIDPVEAIRARDAEIDFSFAGDLGSPQEWDFVGKAEPERPPEPLPEQRAPELAVTSADEEGAASTAPVLAESPTAAPAAQPEPDRLPLATRLMGLASIGGWILVALAFSVGISAVFSQPPERAAVSPGTGEIPIAGLTITASEVKSRVIENALVGNLLVVSGNLENGGTSAVTPRRAVQVQLVSAAGEPIEGATAVAGRALDERSLREHDPDRLRRQLELSAAERAQRPLRPGERVRFDAVFESVPESAAGWVLETITLPSYPDPGNPLPSAAPLVWE